MGARSNFYRSDAWQRFRRVLMMERRGEDGVLLCDHCGLPIVRAYDCIGHHTEELTEDNVADATVSLNPDKVMLVHHRCHNEIHQRFGYGKVVAVKPERRVFYVWGSPLAGKTTFVADAAGERDIVVDLDSIYLAIGTGDRSAVKVNAFNVRDCLLDDIRTRTGRWQNAWVISTEALATNRARIIDRLGAEGIHIDTSMEECIDRAASVRPDSIMYVEEYFRRLTT